MRLVIAGLLLVCACGEETIRLRNTDLLEARYRSSEHQARRGTRRIGEDCFLGSDCETGACYGSPGICSQNCANSGCPLEDLQGNIWPTVCVPIPGQAPVCLRLCHPQTDPCPSVMTECIAGDAMATDELPSSLNACLPVIAAPPVPVDPMVGSECLSTGCEMCITGPNYPNGLCTADCSAAACPAGSICEEIELDGQSLRLCFADCSSSGACEASGAYCQPGNVCR